MTPARQSDTERRMHYMSRLLSVRRSRRELPIWMWDFYDPGKRANFTMGRYRIRRPRT